MNLSVDSTTVDTNQQQQNLNLLLLNKMYQPLVSGKIIKIQIFSQLRVKYFIGHYE